MEGDSTLPGKTLSGETSDQWTWHVKMSVSKHQIGKNGDDMLVTRWTKVYDKVKERIILPLRVGSFASKLLKYSHICSKNTMGIVVGVLKGLN